MKKFFSCLILSLFLTVHCTFAFSQYTLNGSATKISCNCYTLTNAVQTQSGSVWNDNQIDLTSSFDFHFNVYLGCQDAGGADGIVFILQTINKSVGTTGEGLGFEGVTPSVGISLDTWQNVNRNDPDYDHISIQLNGNITHGNDLAGPIPASPSNNNIEDCNWHVLRITWDAISYTLTTYFDGQFRLQAQYDLVTKVFNNDPLVYWGFSGATGGSYNLQQFCTSLNPVFSSNFANDYTCIGKPVLFADQSESFTAIQNFFWDFGDGTTSILQNPFPHNYPSPGAYIVKHAITGMDGCTSDTMKRTISVGAKPIVDFNLGDTCDNETLSIRNQSTSLFGNISQWTWWLDGNVYSNNQVPLISNLPSGKHQIALGALTMYGCGSDTLLRDLTILPAPVVAIRAANGCAGQTINIAGRQIDSKTSISEWSWNLGDSHAASGPDVAHAYLNGGIKSIHLVSAADNGCISHDTTQEIYIEQLFVDAGRDTSVQMNTPFGLHANYFGDFVGHADLTWSPASGLSTIYGSTPSATLQNAQTYYLKAVSRAGCIASDSIKIAVFNFPGVLVPSAFTPNHDGLNDLLRPRYNGIKRLDYFVVYNRWGQLVFKTSDMTKGWDGNYRDQVTGTAVFVWIVSAEDYDGKKYQLRGTTSIVK